MPSGITKVGETQIVNVTNCNENLCFKEDIVYEAPMPQIIALLESSGSCSQTIDFQCFSAPLQVMIKIDLEVSAAHRIRIISIISKLGDIQNMNGTMGPHL